MAKPEQFSRNYNDLLMQIGPQVIRSEQEYERQLRNLDALMRLEGPSPKRNGRAKMIDLLSQLIAAYEASSHPLPTQSSPRQLLEHLMEARGLTQSKLAQELGYGRQLINNVLTSRRAISKDLAIKLAAYFRVPPGFFLEEKNDGKAA